MAASIDISNATKAYARRRSDDVVALDGVSVRVEAGELVALLGPNGSGKSTLIGALSGTVTLDSGDATCGGRRAVVFQSPGLDPLLTVDENLRLEAALHGIARADVAARVEAVCAQLGVADRAADRVGTLSGGLARRVDLARALLARPEVLLLDEASTGLDPIARSAFLDSVNAARRGGAMAVLMSTHLIEEAERADRVVMLAGGRVVADDTPTALAARVGARRVRVRGGDALDGVRTALESSGWDVAAEQSMLRDGIEAFRGEADRDAEASVLEASLAAGATCEIGAPTLGDAYRALAGAELAGVGDRA